MAEVKHRQTAISERLLNFREQNAAPFAFQVVVDVDYVDAACFGRPGGPIVIPVRTFLS